MRSIVRKTLAATRFPLDVTEADEGFAALKLVRERDFHVVFLDYNMPDFSAAWRPSPNSSARSGRSAWC